MQTFTLGLGRWSRLWMGNPLVRATDRVEAAATLLAVFLAIVAIPIAAAAGTAVHDDLVHTFAAQSISRHAVDGVALRDSRLVAEPYERPYLTEVSWQFNGITHGDEMRTGGMDAGEQLTIWVDDAGNRTQKPLSDEDAAAQAVIAALALWSAVAGSAAGLWLLLRLRLNHVRFRAWDRALDDLADNGGRTNNNTP